MVSAGARTDQCSGHCAACSGSISAGHFESGCMARASQGACNVRHAPCIDTHKEKQISLAHLEMFVIGGLSVFASVHRTNTQKCEELRHIPAVEQCGVHVPAGVAVLGSEAQSGNGQGVVPLPPPQVSQLSNLTQKVGHLFYHVHIRPKATVEWKCILFISSVCSHIYPHAPCSCNLAYSILQITRVSYHELSNTSSNPLTA